MYIKILVLIVKNTTETLFNDLNIEDLQLIYRETVWDCLLSGTFIIKDKMLD